MTRDRLCRAEGGAGFAEVFVALALTMIELAGAMEAFQAAERSLRLGMLVTRALAMAESRIEAKRAARWDRLLLDDLNYDGISDLVMHDDGTEGDVLAGDGVPPRRKLSPTSPKNVQAHETPPYTTFNINDL